MDDLGHILVIDDSEDDCDLFERFLTRQPRFAAKIHFAHTGEDGLRLARTIHPDCILLDYSLPGRDGLAILQELRRFDRQAAVVMLTGQGNEAVAVEVMKAGARDYLVKGAISADSLGRAIANATAQQRLANKLHQQRESLEIFARAMAHDLKEPLRTIKSFGRIIQDRDGLPADTRDLLDFVLRAADNMEGLITSVSRYTRLESYDRIENKPVSIAEILELVITNLNQQVASRRARIVSHDLSNLTGDRALLTQLLQNLVSNAIHYCTERAPLVTVSSPIVDGRLQLRVADNGPGVAEEFREEIFKPFKRLVGRNVEGSGLGLAICRKIADLHGASIHCEAGQSGGTVFVTEFPTDRSLLPEIDEDASGIESLGRDFARTAEVLLVEDSPADVHLTRLKLMEMEKVHFHLHVASNGQEAINWIERRIGISDQPGPDLMLLDINMPIMDGFQVLDSLRADARLRHIPVFMLSTSSDESDMTRARDHGARAYMVKPASSSQLREALKTVDNLKLIESGAGLRLMA